MKKANWKALAALLGALTFVLFLYRAWVLPGTDAEAYVQAGLRVWARESPYHQSDLTPFKYFPIVAYLFIPLAFVPFQYFKLLIFFTSWCSGAFLYKEAASRVGPLSTLLLFVFFYRFHNYDFLNLQINHWIALLLWLYLREREKRPWLSAACFSLMAAFKLTPLVLCVPLLFLRKWKELGRIGVTFLAFLVLPALHLKSGFGVYADWYELVKLTTPWPAPDFPIVQSVQAGLWFWLNGVISPQVFLLLVNLLYVVLLGLTLFAFRQKRARDEIPLLCAVSVIAVIFSPLAWKHVYLLLWPAVFVIVQKRMWRTFAAAALLMSVGPGLVSIISKHVADRSYMTVMGALVLLFSLARLRREAQGEFSDNTLRA